MKISKQINSYRRSIMRSLTKNIGDSHLHLNPLPEAEIRRILISRPNHRLGNLLLLTALVQEVSIAFPNSKIDLLVKGGIAPAIFREYGNIDRIIQLPKKPFSNIGKYLKGWLSIRFQQYDLSINAIENSSSGRLSVSFSNATCKFFGAFDEQLNLEKSDYQHHAKYPIYNIREFIATLGINRKEQPITFLDLKLTLEEIASGAKKLHAITGNDKKTICLFTNATGAKCYSEIWWLEFYENLKAEFPNCAIIELLPIENTSMLRFKIPTFYSTDIREMGAFIANTTLFIAADSGVMHLSSAVGTPTIGLFSTTNPNRYQPYNTASIAIDTNTVEQHGMIQLIRQQFGRSLSIR